MHSKASKGISNCILLEASLCLEILRLYHLLNLQSLSYPELEDFGGSGLGLLRLGISLDFGGGANFL